jgi:predicted RNA polymerase sigma factor
VPLAEQDRTLWHSTLMAEVSGALPMGAVGEYQLQAAIAAVHDEAATAEETDWPQILALYGLLEQMTSNPMVTLNRAVAAAIVDGPAAGLALLERLDERLADHHRLAAVRAHLLEMSGERRAAIAQYHAAAARTTSVAERNYLLARAARITATTD